MKVNFIWHFHLLHHLILWLILSVMYKYRFIRLSVDVKFKLVLFVSMMHFMWAVHTWTPSIKSSLNAPINYDMLSHALLESHALMGIQGCIPVNYWWRDPCFMDKNVSGFRIQIGIKGFFLWPINIEIEVLYSCDRAISVLKLWKRRNLWLFTYQVLFD